MHSLLSRLMAACAALVSCAAIAAPYPDKPVRFVVPYVAGSPADLVARKLGEDLARQLGQPFIVENKAGANGNLGSDVVAKAKPDGYTLLLTTNATIVINPQLFGDQVKYDPEKDFAPVTLMSSLPFVFLVPPSSPAKTMEEFITLAKKNPGTLDCGSSGMGGGAHLALEMLKLRAKVDLTHVPYKGTGSSVTALLGGHIDCLFVSILSATPYIKQGQLRPLAVSSLQRNPSLPDIPAVAELPGLAGFESDLWYGLLAPAGTSPAIVQKIYEGTKAMLDDPDIRARFEPTGALLVGGTPEEFSKLITRDIKKWTETINASNVKAQL